ncbi:MULTISPECIES: ABC transporter ATP-binding protein [unclassified Cupriavidus]|jgi:osmoprotectant transport system ATP-binding protein|uniref:osmoprotectant ABC transporter ATP-binding protein OsmV n=1 Tax=unclassified Cupriavidus TaxID=2640874 RepID=UPI001C0049D9|nr:MULTISPECIES: ABC transporter ATP-binding protein [unclassified Cupriavidus]MCA3193107.1 ABC transporter ATP-binding protein [Cupriavidus sp.]MCA3195960.1 ABC transporter ATP-binding protein [Cupriavidus sp.]MCA3204861.1 ABC transporter ATP-binding protein [Cupriavidus sp.]MCA3207988.1 ABC transporter ATP-binding protein [Cupriavidus sp.]MCA3231137.1 ABC transporter ATP-binding protein [Cupriavidus sp.]
MIELDKLTKAFPQKDGTEVRAVNEVSMTVPRGEICVFLGPSGCGKTTTLKMINRLIQPTSGTVRIDGEDTTGIDGVTLRRKIGYVIQQIGLFPNMTIEENIMVVPRLLGWDKKQCRERARELIRMVQLDPDKMLKRYPRELSGGQQQRIGVIRALAADAPVLLMDEPFGAVDPINRESIQNEFFQMQRQLGKTVIMVSHDIDEAIKLGDKVAVFRAGRLVQFDHPDALLAHPADDFVQAFVGHDNTLKRLLLVRAGDAATLPPSCRPDMSLAEAFGVMDDADVRHLPVVDDAQRALGYVTRRDVRNALAKGGSCAEVMRQFTTTAAFDEHLRIVLSRMYQHNTSWLPVIDGEGVYLGEVTQESIADYLSSGRSRGNAPVIQPPASSPVATIGPAPVSAPQKERVAA